MNNCHTIYNGSHDDITKISVHLLLRKVFEKSKAYLADAERERVLLEERARAREERKQAKLIRSTAEIEGGLADLGISTSNYTGGEETKVPSAAHALTARAEDKNVSVFMMESPSRIAASSEDVFIRNVYMLSLEKSPLMKAATGITNKHYYPHCAFMQKL